MEGTEVNPTKMKKPLKRAGKKKSRKGVRFSSDTKVNSVDDKKNEKKQPTVDDIKNILQTKFEIETHKLKEEYVLFVELYLSEKTITLEQFKQLSPFITPKILEEIVIEREIEDHCGCVFCKKRIDKEANATLPEKKLNQQAGKEVSIVDCSDRKLHCSDKCTKITNALKSRLEEEMIHLKPIKQFDPTHLDLFESSSPLMKNLNRIYNEMAAILKKFEMVASKVTPENRTDNLVREHMEVNKDTKVVKTTQRALHDKKPDYKPKNLYDSSRVISKNELHKMEKDLGELKIKESIVNEPTEADNSAGLIAQTHSIEGYSVKEGKKQEVCQKEITQLNPEVSSQVNLLEGLTSAYLDSGMGAFSGKLLTFNYGNEESPKDLKGVDDDDGNQGDDEGDDEDQDEEGTEEHHLVEEAGEEEEKQKEENEKGDEEDEDEYEEGTEERHLVEEADQEEEKQEDEIENGEDDDDEEQTQRLKESGEKLTDDGELSDYDGELSDDPEDDEFSSDEGEWDMDEYRKVFEMSLSPSDRITDALIKWKSGELIDFLERGIPRTNMTQKNPRHYPETKLEILDKHIIKSVPKLLRLIDLQEETITQQTTEFVQHMVNALDVSSSSPDLKEALWVVIAYVFLFHALENVVMGNLLVKEALKSKAFERTLRLADVSEDQFRGFMLSF